MTATNRNFLFGAVVGSGLTAQAADRAGADYLLALNAGRFRVQGASSLTSFLPVRPANEWVFEFAEREMLGRCTAPIYAGVSVSDPNLDIQHLVDRIRSLEFAGVCNFPSTTLIDGRLGALMEREGLGFSRELDLVRRATTADLKSVVYVVTNAQARAMAEAGATTICVNIGFTSGGTGVNTHLGIESAAAQIDRVLDGVPASVERICHGGPITSPEEALAVIRISRAQGFVAGSTLDRLPLEKTLDDVARSFQAIPHLMRAEPNQKSSDDQFIGSSHALQSIRREIQELANEEIPVLLSGETGTGKSLAARMLHELGSRAPFKPVTIDCPSLNLDQGSALLLGTAAGPRGSTASTRGALEQANGSTVMFEEVGGLRPEHQGQILRFADEKLVQRIGDTTPRSVSARIVSTTSMDLRSRFDEDLFRKDLFFRLCGYEITLPPLRDRPDDIPELALHLARQANHGTGIRFTNAALRRLMQHGWPGNIRELKNVVLRACRKSNGRTIDLKSLDFLEQQAAMEVQQKPQIEPVSDTQTEREWIAQALARNGFRRAQTAKELGITTRTLFNKIKKHRLQS